MGRCRYENLSHIEPALDQIRKFADLKEPKPGIFYFKSQGFLHFHEKDGKIWADVKGGAKWISIDVPPASTKKISKAFTDQFVKDVRLHYSQAGGK